MTWNKLSLSRSELNLSTVLRSGQAFRWRKIDDIWSCALNNQIILLKQDTTGAENTYIEYQGIPESPGLEKFLASYLNTEISAVELYNQWSKIDRNFTLKDVNIVKEEFEGQKFLMTPPKTPEPDIISDISYSGVRILSQDPWETLVSFIISQNNNIKRISQLCEILCINYGSLIGNKFGLPYYTFPKPYELFKLKSYEEEITEAMKAELEKELRLLGFGYRAGYIMKTAFDVCSTEETREKLYNSEWSNDEECIEFLLKFNGVGPKVADCVALMGCKRHNLVPIDTHVWNILCKNYKQEFNKWIDDFKDWNNVYDIPKSNVKKSLNNKSVNVKMYPFVKRFFNDFWNIKAGWAQAVVFATVVKLDNGINTINDMNKLIEKIESSIPKPSKRVKK